MDTSHRIEEDLKRLQTTKGVSGYIVINSEGQTIRSWNLDSTTATQYATHVKQLTMNALSMVRTLDPQNDLTFLRLRSKKHEIMVSPGNGYDIIVLQNPKEAS